MSKEGDKKVYDLTKRTGLFGVRVLEFCKALPRDPILLPLINQIVRSSTSIGANYCEADCAESKKDFEHKIGICRKESQETKHWLHMIAIANPDAKALCRSLWKEANELNLIFSRIILSSRKNNIPTSKK